MACAGLLAAPGAVLGNEPDRTATLVPMEAFAWEGETATGISGVTTLTPYPGDPGDCDSPNEHCDRTLLQVTGRPDRMLLAVAIRSGGYESYFGDDLDLYVYESDASGSLGRFVAESSNGDSDPEHVSIRDPRGWYLVHVVWSWAVESSFKAYAVTGELPPPDPPAAGELGPPLTATVGTGSASLASLLGRGLPVGLSCSTDCSAEIALQPDRRTARRARLPLRPVAGGRLALVRAGIGTVRLRAAPATRRRLRRLRSFSGTVTASVRNGAGLQTQVTQAVRLRRR